MIDGLPSYHRILVALDGSPVAEQALPHALVMAKACGAELILLRVIPSTLLHLATGPARAAKREKPADDEEMAARSYLEAVAENLRTQQVAVSIRVRRGGTAATILEESAHADLLALCRRGAGPLPRMLLGSVALQVLPAAPCPVLLIQVLPEGLAKSERVQSFTEDAERYGALMQRPLGLRTVALDRIVGGVGDARTSWDPTSCRRPGGTATRGSGASTPRCAGAPSCRRWTCTSWATTTTCSTAITAWRQPRPAGSWISMRWSPNSSRSAMRTRSGCSASDARSRMQPASPGSARRLARTLRPAGSVDSTICARTGDSRCEGRRRSLVYAGISPDGGPLACGAPGEHFPW